LVGVWRTTGTHPLVPGTTFHGRTSFEWHEDGAFVLMRSEIDEPEIPSAVAVIGSDDAAGTFTMIYFDERDISRRYTVEVADGEVRWHRDEAGFASAWCSPSPPTAPGSTREGRCHTTAARGKTTSSSPMSASTRRTRLDAGGPGQRLPIDRDRPAWGRVS
jgi:hypothetical protein